MPVLISKKKASLPFPVSCPLWAVSRLIPLLVPILDNRPDDNLIGSLGPAAQLYRFHLLIIRDDPNSHTGGGGIQPLPHWQCEILWPAKGARGHQRTDGCLDVLEIPRHILLVQ